MADTNHKPAIDYTDKDFASLREALFDLAAYRLPEWTDRSASDIGVLLVDLFAHVGDMLSYYQDRIASEAFLDTAVERRSVMHLLRLIGYELAPPLAATAELTLTFRRPGSGQPTTVTVPAGAEFGTTADEGRPSLPFVFLGPDRTLDLADDALVHTGLPVRHGRSVADEVLGSATGEPNQRFLLAESPVVLETLRVVIDEGAGPVEWERATNLLYGATPAGDLERSSPEARQYVVQFDQDGRASVVFGDGEYGRRPPVGRDNVRASYMTGGGSAGNVPAGAIADARTRLRGLVSVTNPAPAVGGADAEPVDRAVRFGPLAFRSGDRAVTLSDYVAIALQAGGVAKVRARTTGWNRVELIVAPEGERYSPAPDELKRRLVAHFETRRMLGTSVHVRDPQPVPVDVSVEVTVEAHHEPDITRARAEQAIGALLAFHTVDFGRPLYLSKVYEAVEALDGVHAATVTRFRRRDQAPPRTLRRKVLLDAGLGAVSDLVQRAYGGEIAVEGRIDIGELELPVPGTLTVTVGMDAP